VTTRVRSAAPRFFARLAALAFLVLAAWQIVDLALHGWVVWQEHLVQTLQNAGLRANHRIPPLAALGEADAPVQIVAACDAIEPSCRTLLGRLLNWRDRHADDTRLVWLQRPAAEPDSEQLAAALQATASQSVLWPVLRRLSTEPGRLTVAQVQKAVVAARGFASRWQRDLDDSDVLMHVVTDRTMAQALEIPEDVSVIVSGVPLLAGDVRDQATLDTALDLRAAQAIATGGDRAALLALLAERPKRVRERYDAWILRGERLSALPREAPRQKRR
jgi:hypothetical protein